MFLSPIGTKWLGVLCAAGTHTSYPIFPAPKALLLQGLRRFFVLLLAYFGALFGSLLFAHAENICVASNSGRVNKREKTVNSLLIRGNEAAACEPMHLHQRT